MKVHIYVLFLSIWTVYCLDRNRTNDSPNTTTTTIIPDTSVDKTTESTGSRMDDFRKRLLGFIVGIMIIAFTFTCFCLLHYNCMVEEVQSPRGLNKENMEAISSWVSKVSACQPDSISEDNLEIQPLLLNSDQVSKPSCQEQPPIPCSAIKSIPSSSAEKPYIPSNAQKSMRYTNTEETPMSYNVKKSSKQSDAKRSTKLSSSQGLYKSFHLEKSYKKHGFKKSRNLNRAYKFSSQTNTCTSDKEAIPPWLAVLETSATLSTPGCSPLPQNKILPTKSSRIKKRYRSRRYYDLKKSMNTRKAVLSKLPGAKSCRHKERCLVCTTSESLTNDLLGTKKEHAINLHVSEKMKPSSKFFSEKDYKHNERPYKYNSYYKTSSDDDIKTFDSEDSGTEVVILCDVNNEDDVMSWDDLSH